MSPIALLAAVSLASFALTSSVCSAAVAAVWRAGWLSRGGPAASRARRIFHARVLPSAAGAALTLGLVVPAFLRFESPQAREAAGPALLALAAGPSFSSRRP